MPSQWNKDFWRRTPGAPGMRQPQGVRPRQKAQSQQRTQSAGPAATPGSQVRPISLAKGPNSQFKYGQTIPIKVTEPGGKQQNVYGRFEDYGPAVKTFDFATSGKYAPWKNYIPAGASITYTPPTGGQPIQGTVYNPGGGGIEGGLYGAGPYSNQMLTPFKGQASAPSAAPSPSPVPVASHSNIQTPSATIYGGSPSGSLDITGANPETSQVTGNYGYPPAVFGETGGFTPGGEQAPVYPMMNPSTTSTTGSYMNLGVPQVNQAFLPYNVSPSGLPVGSSDVSGVSSPGTTNQFVSPTGETVGPASDSPFSNIVNIGDPWQAVAQPYMFGSPDAAPVSSPAPASPSAATPDAPGYFNQRYGSLDITSGVTPTGLQMPGMNYSPGPNGSTYVYDSNWNYVDTMPAPGGTSLPTAPAAALAPYATPAETTATPDTAAPIDFGNVPTGNLSDRPAGGISTTWNTTLGGGGGPTQFGNNTSGLYGAFEGGSPTGFFSQGAAGLPLTVGGASGGYNAGPGEVINRYSAMNDAMYPDWMSGQYRPWLGFNPLHVSPKNPTGEDPTAFYQKLIEMGYGNLVGAGSSSSDAPILGSGSGTTFGSEGTFGAPIATSGGTGYADVQSAGVTGYTQTPTSASLPTTNYTPPGYGGYSTGGRSL